MRALRSTLPRDATALVLPFIEGSSEFISPPPAPPRLTVQLIVCSLRQRTPVAFGQPNPGSDDFLIAEDRSGTGYSSSSADDIICPFGRSGLVFSICNHDELRVSKRERSSGHGALLIVRERDGLSVAARLSRHWP